MVLLGIVPVLMQAPPTTSRLSTTATRLPASRRDGGALPRRAGADDDQIESVHERRSGKSHGSVSAPRVGCLEANTFHARLSTQADGEVHPIVRRGRHS